MRQLIEQLARQMRQPVSIAYRLVMLGHFDTLEDALKYVDSIVGNVPFRRN